MEARKRGAGMDIFPDRIEGVEIRDNKMNCKEAVEYHPGRNGPEIVTKRDKKANLRIRVVYI